MKWYAFSMIAVLLATASTGPAQSKDAEAKLAKATSAETESLRKAMFDRVTAEAFDLSSPEIAAVFEGKFFYVKTSMKDGSGTTGIGKTKAVQLKGKTYFLHGATTNQPCPVLTKLVKSSFRLKKEADAKKLEAAFAKILFNKRSLSRRKEKDKEAQQVFKRDDAWYIVRGLFFENGKGYVVKTDKSGKITDISYSLQIELPKQK